MALLSTKTCEKGEIIMTKRIGIVTEEVMEHETLSLEAKGIYSYLTIYKNKNNQCWPAVKTVCEKLHISEKRFHKYKNELIEAGVLTLERNQKGKGWANNIYTIIDHSITGQIDMLLNPVTGQIDPIQESITGQFGGLVTGQFGGSNNSFNSFKKEEEEEGAPAASLVHPADGKMTRLKDEYTAIIGEPKHGILKTLGEWAKTMDAALIVHAMELASFQTEQPGKEPGYFFKTASDWYAKGYRTLDDLPTASKPKPAADKPAKTKRYSKPAAKVESLPDWAQEEQKPVVETPLSPEDEAKLNARIAKLLSSGK
jgi:hypothetical protein